MKYAALFCLAIIFIIGCNQEEIACTMDAKICPDGTAVGRIPPSCNFAECPIVAEDVGVPGCDYEEEGMDYVQKNRGECNVINFVCVKGKEPFFNNCGCGCKDIEECNYESSEKDYKGKSTDECARIRFACDDGKEYFSDKCGCGCQAISEGKLKATDCPTERPEICTMNYNPVCGWFDPAKIQCIKYPCANTYSNSCHACSDPDVISWTEGECPE